MTIRMQAELNPDPMLKAWSHICYAIPITRDRVAVAAFQMRGIVEVRRHRLADTVGSRSSQLAVRNGLASQCIGMPRATHSIRVCGRVGSEEAARIGCLFNACNVDLRTLVRA